MKGLWLEGENVDVSPYLGTLNPGGAESNDC